MEIKVYLGLLTLFAVLFLVTGNSSKENIKELSKLKIRKKRIIDLTQYGRRQVTLKDVPYIVNIHANNESICAGNILTAHIVVTAAHCFIDKNVTYTILAASRFRNRGMPHYIVRKIFHPVFRSIECKNDLVLLVVRPPIEITHSPNRVISLHNGYLHPRTAATISGWGCANVINNTQIFPLELRSTIVSVISLEDCQSAYPELITEKHICTFDKNKKRGGSFGDSGGPLVVNGKLAGIISWSTKSVPVECPDVFVNLSHIAYSKWIAKNLHHIR